MPVLAVLFVICVSISCFLLGADARSTSLEVKCIVKYADMPHNQVEDHCKTILKFEKDVK